MALTKPTQITVPFASSGLKNTIPETATGSNRASMQEGFPAITMQDVDQGGMAPYGQDMNGIIYDVTKAIQYQQAGGFFPYDATFAPAIDGYPIGAIVTSADGTQLFQNTLDGNQSDPENGGANWSNIMTSASLAGKQDKLNQTQMDAVNSGITSAKVAIYDSYESTKQNTLTFDNTPTNGSSNPVTSDGIYTALGTKQDTITVDASPTDGSTNPVQSGGVYSALADKVDIADADDAEVTATGSTTAHTLSDWMKFMQEPKTGRKKIVFSVNFKCPDYDELMAKTYKDGAVNLYIYPQAANRFVKNGIEYLFIFSGCSTSIEAGEPNFRIITVYNLNTGEYLGYFLITGTRVTEGFVVKSESDGDYIYIANSNDVLAKGKFDLTQFETTITTSPVLDGDGNTISAYWFVSCLNGTWCIDGTANRMAGFSSRTLLFYDDNFNKIGQFDVQKYEQDVWAGYEGLTAEQQKVQWSIPRTQGICIGIDGVYFYKGGGTNAADTAFPLTDCGVDHYNFQGDLVRSSVCRHTPFANKLLPLLGVTSAINHTECEGGFCTEDGRCFWFGVVGAQSGKLVLMEEFSDAYDAIDFSDSLANRQSNIPFQSNTPSFPRTSGGFRNPWTGEVLQSVDEFIKMCAIWGLDEITVSNYGGLGTSCAGTTLSSGENFILHLQRYSYNRFFMEVFKNATDLPRTYIVGLDSGNNVTTCTVQRANLYATTVGTTSFSPASNGSASLGTSSLRWSEVFANTATINTSDERLKDNISDIEDAVLDAWGDVNLKVFQFKDAIEKKGQDARIHAGVIAQQVQQAFEARGLDAFRYGLLCYDAWDAKDAVMDEDGTEIEPAQPAGNRYSIRYEEALILEAAYQRRRADRIEERLQALEERLGA